VAGADEEVMTRIRPSVAWFCAINDTVENVAYNVILVKETFVWRGCETDLGAC